MFLAMQSSRENSRAVQCLTRGCRQVSEMPRVIPLQGVIVYFRVVDGELKVGDVVKLMNTGKEYQVDELGVLAPKPVQVRSPK